MINFLRANKKIHFQQILNTKNHRFIAPSSIERTTASVMKITDKETEKSIEIPYPVNIGTRFNMLLSEESYKKALNYIYSNDD